MLIIRFDEPFFTRGQFPPTIQNNSQIVALPNPWVDRPNSAPFDQRACFNFLNIFWWFNLTPLGRCFLALRCALNPCAVFFRQWLVADCTAFFLIMNVAVGG